MAYSTFPFISISLLWHQFNKMVHSTVKTYGEGIYLFKFYFHCILGWGREAYYSYLEINETPNNFSALSFFKILHYSQLSFSSYDYYFCTNGLQAENVTYLKIHDWKRFRLLVPTIKKSNRQIKWASGHHHYLLGSLSFWVCRVLTLFFKVHCSNKCQLKLECDVSWGEMYSEG